MQKNDSGEQNVEKRDQITVQDIESQAQQVQVKSPSIKIESDSQYSEDQRSQRQQQQMRHELEQKQSKAQTSLESISIQSPVKKHLIKSEAKSNEKAKNSQKNSPTKISNKVENSIKQRQEQEAISNSKLHSESYMKSSIKSNQKMKKINKPFYEETFYITGMKENYLLLLSDTNQVLQFPIGMFTTQSQAPESQKRWEQGSMNENFHLRKDIKIGQPIKIKLEFDFLRQEKDDRIFNSVQRAINQEYSEANEEPLEIRGKELSIKKNK